MGSTVLLMDAKNEFIIPSIDPQLYAWNVSVKWPQCPCLLTSTYRGYASLLLQGSSEVILNREGVAQGNPFNVKCMLHAVLMPLIKSLSDQCQWNHNRYAADSNFQT